MKRMRIGRPSPALVISVISLFVALGGVGYAAATIGSAQIKNNSIRSKDIRNGQVTSKDVKKNGLGGRSVKESALGKVPSASRADTASSAGSAGSANTANFANAAGNANTVAGGTIRKINYRSDADETERTVLSLNGLELVADCTGGDVDVLARTTVSNSYIQTAQFRITGPPDEVDVSFDKDFDTDVDLEDILAADDTNTGGVLQYSNPQGESVTVSWAATEDSPVTDGSDCVFTGTATG